MKFIIYFITLLLVFFVSCEKSNDFHDKPFTNFEKPGYTYVPDTNFEKALIRLGYDTIIDGYVTTTVIDTVTALTINSRSIKDLTGIEGFSAITWLLCNNNLLTSLDFSKNTSLIIIQCGNNPLTKLDVSQNKALKLLNCINSKITNLDLSKNLELGELAISNNPIKNLDLSNNILLQNLSCSHTNLTSLDLSKNRALKSLFCPMNKINTLNLKNGNNKSLRVNVKNNNLSCVEVDAPSWAKEYWKDDFDNSVTFSTNCNY